MTEIDIEDVGTLRHANDWQIARIKHMHDKANAYIAWMAFPLGMTVQQFKKLPVEKREEIRLAKLTLDRYSTTAPDKMPNLPWTWR